MFIPAVYAVALSMIIFSMIAWGSWANALKLCKGWRFELLYWDYVWGILLMALILGFTLGRTAPASPDSFIQNLRAADGHHFLLAFLGGVVFNIGNILIVAAIAIAGMAVAFPVGIGLALVIGSVLNYIITPKGNPLMLFGGIALVCLAIAAGRSGLPKAGEGSDREHKRDRSQRAGWCNDGTVLPFHCQGYQRREPPWSVHRGVRLCSRSTGF